MKPQNPAPSILLPNASRRRFVQGLAAGGVVMSLPIMNRARAAGLAASGTAPELRGTEFDLLIAETPVNFTGNTRMATTINGSIPGPTLRWREGDTVTLRVTNHLKVDTSIHWHGILLPYQMDGVPGISFRGIAPGETFTYTFKVQQTGTYWYHSHSGMQEQTGMYGAIVIESASDARRADRDYIVQLSDWTDEDPEAVFHQLKHQSDYYNFNQPTVPDFFRDISREGLSSALAQRQMWNEMRMSPYDLADISGYTYTYLMNGKTSTGNWTGLFKRGEKVRLRIINAGAMSFFDVRIPGLKMTVIQTDGQDVEPVTVDELRIAVAETFDVIVEPQDEAYTIFAQSMDRSGFTSGTLTTRMGVNALIPAVDAISPLTMGDMMGGMDHSAHGGGVENKAEIKGMAGMDHSSHGAMAMDHSKHAMNPNIASSTVRHARTEYGPSVDMRVDTPRTNLDDPGTGLRDNGRRVLTYNDLHTVGGPMDPRGAEREMELHLTGNMERYAWSLDGLEFGKSTPVHFRHGERLRVILHNDTMMTHPMHLHGLWSELENASGEFMARKHVIAVQPAQRVSFLVTADALGRWAWHCHLLFHMDAGMFREVVVS